MTDAEKKAEEWAMEHYSSSWGDTIDPTGGAIAAYLAGYAEGRKAFTSEVSEIMERAYAKTGKYFSGDILDLLYDELSLKGEK